jgi:hypothetical protein
MEGALADHQPTHLKTPFMGNDQPRRRIAGGQREDPRDLYRISRTEGHADGNVGGVSSVRQERRRALPARDGKGFSDFTVGEEWAMKWEKWGRRMASAQRS